MPATSVRTGANEGTKPFFLLRSIVFFGMRLHRCGSSSQVILRTSEIKRRRRPGVAAANGSSARRRALAYVKRIGSDM